MPVVWKNPVLNWKECRHASYVIRYGYTVPSMITPEHSGPGGKFFRRLAQGLEKTRARLLGVNAELFKARSDIDKTLLGELEMQLISADVGIETTAGILADLESNLQTGRCRAT